MTRAFLMTALLALTACGFQPVHSRAYQMEQSATLSAITVNVNTSRRGQLLEAEIKDRLNPAHIPAEPLYRLTMSIAEEDIPLFINPDGTSSRGDLRFTTNYVLTRAVDGREMHKGTIQRIASYNTSDTADYASYVSVEDAKRRAIIELARDYQMRMTNVLERLRATSERVEEGAP